MLIFLDTEFTDFFKMELISIALVTEDEREFYAERTDFRREDCSEFVRAAVLPVLGRVPGSECNRGELTNRLRAWFEALPEPGIAVFDYVSDWDLLADALAGDDEATMPQNLGGKLVLGDLVIDSHIFYQAREETFSLDWPRHHALADARALRAGYAAWKEAEGQLD